MYKIILFIVFAMVSLFCQAQNSDNLNPCGSPIDHKAESWLEDFKLGKIEYKKNEDEIWIAMTVHLVSPTDFNSSFRENDALKALCKLNEDFKETKIQFYLKGFNYINNDNYYIHDFTFGIQMMNNFNVSGTANSYFVNDPAGNCGYFAPSGGAVAVAFSCAGPYDATWAHEMGHYLSLPHTFRGWEGTEYEIGTVAPEFIGNRKVERFSENSDCKVAGDRFCDTPADYLSYRWNCNNNFESSEIQLDPDSISFRSNGTNFMSYSNSSCKSIFSLEQIEAMRANVTNTKSSQITENYIQTEIEVSDTKLLFPINDEEVNEESFTMTWEEIGSAKYYFLEISTVVGYQILHTRKIIEGTSYEVSNLKPNKKYYWRLTPYGESDFCTGYTESQTFVTNFITSLSENDINNQVSIYPNPSSDKFIIDFKSEGPGSMKLYDSRFQLILEKDLKDTKTIIETSNYSEGIYFLSIIKGDLNISKKIIIQ